MRARILASDKENKVGLSHRAAEALKNAGASMCSKEMAKFLFATSNGKF
jgi:hypothetical protein